MPYPRTQESKLAVILLHYSFCAKRQAGKLQLPFSKSSARFDLGIEPRSTYCKADVLTALPVRPYFLLLLSPIFLNYCSSLCMRVCTVNGFFVGLKSSFC